MRSRTSDRAAGRGAPLAAMALALTVAIAFADSAIVMLGLPEIYSELETSVPAVSLVVTAYNLVLAVAALALLGPVRRRRPAALVGLGAAVFLLGSVASGLAGGIVALVGGRALQGLGAALLLAASLPLLVHLTGSARAGRAWWGAAATIGVAAGPVAGGLLTEALGWRAIFLVQAPMALLALAVARVPGVRALGPEGRTARVPGARRANLALALAFAGLVGALFLAVLMVVTVWDLGPLPGAVVVSALPLAALAVRPFGRRVGDPAGPAAGAVLLASGLLGLALLPAADAAWAAAALGICGIGFGLLVPPLATASVATDRGLGAAATRTVAARHLGLVLALAAVAPLLAVQLEDAGRQASLDGAAVMLDAPVALDDKIPLALDLAAELERAPEGEVPALEEPFARRGAGEDAALAATRDDLVGAIEAALTRAFASSYLLAAALALAALVPVLARRGAWRAVAARRPAALGLVALAALALPLAEVSLGGGRPGAPLTRDACAPGGGTRDGPRDAGVQRTLSSGLYGAACALGTSREQLVLSFADVEGVAPIEWDDATVERAIRSALVRAIDDAERRGSLNGTVATVLRAGAERAPVQEAIAAAERARALVP